MAVIQQYRVKYTCDLESELSLTWGEGAIAYCKENSGKTWTIENNAWIIKVYENQPAATAAAVPQDATHRFVTDAEKATWDAKAAGGHNHAGVYEPVNANIQSHIGTAHAPSNAQKNSDITKGEIEAKLIGEINTHTHPGGGGGLTQQQIEGIL